jgi:CarboxypepD_reg-like domain
MRIKVKYTLLFVFSILLALPLIAQQTALIRGTITDGASGEAVDLATLAIKGTTSAVFTDERGQYTISVPAGERQTLIVRRVGYQEATTRGVDIWPMHLHPALYIRDRRPAMLRVQTVCIMRKQYPSA